MEKKALLRTEIILCTIIILGFATTSLISYHSNRDIFRQDVEHISTLTSEGICRQIDSIFTKPINISLTMANDSLLKDFLRKEKEKVNDKTFTETMRSYLLTYKEKYGYDSVFLASTGTNRYYHFDKGVDRVLTKDNPENKWYYSFLESSEEYSINIDNDEVATADNEITVFVNCKIKNSDGKIMGIVGVGFRVNYLQKIFKRYEEKFNLKAYLADNKGTIQISTNQTGYREKNLFTYERYKGLEEKVLSKKKEMKSFWYSLGRQKGYIVTQYIKNLEWHLIIDHDTSALEEKLNWQFLIGIIIIVVVIITVLIVVTSIVRKYNSKVVKLVVEKEKKHRSLLQTETEKFYENIYEIDVTHNRAAGEETENYFESLGVPKDTSFDKALYIIAEKQIKKEYRQGYLSTFCPENVMKSYQEGVESLRYDFMISNDEGYTYYWMRITARIFYWDEDKSVRLFVFRQNIDEEKQREKYLFEKMESDSLTGLYNKAATQKHIQNLLTTNKEKFFAFFILDIDNFKRVNDTCGHATGDLVIMDFSKILKRYFKNKGIVGRIGGDEFAVFVPFSSKEWIEKTARELVSILHHDFSDGEKWCSISASIGVAVAPEAGTEFETLYKNADFALYHTKENGKDGFTVYHSS